MKTTAYQVGDTVKLSRTLSVKIVGQSVLRGVSHWNVLQTVTQPSKPTATSYGWMSMSALENMNGVKL